MAARKVKSVLESEGYVREVCIINGGKVLVFADTHFSSTYEGKHISYIFDCLDNMSKILDIIRKEKPKAVIFLGDIIGVNERNISDRQFLMRIIKFFGLIYNAVKGNVFCVKGNHDMGDFSDYDMLVGLGYLKNPKYIDYKTPDGNSTEIRFHLVNYGDEKNQLELEKEEASNIVLGHADYYIDGVTNWYSEKKGRVELRELKNFCGVEMVVSGHIHTPSTEMMYTTMPDGESIGLFYPGSCSRTAERFDDCWYMCFEYSETDKSTGYKSDYMGLKNANEVFHDNSEFIDEKTEDEEELERHMEVLDTIIKEIFDSRLATGDLFAQIDRIPEDTDVKECAKGYLRQAIDGV